MHESREFETTDEINDDDIPNSVTIQTQIASLIHLLFVSFVRSSVRPTYYIYFELLFLK